MLAVALLAPAARAGDGEAPTDARTIAAVDARTDAWPIATPDAVDVVRRRRHLVLRLVLAERLRVRRAKTKTVQGEEHGRRPHRARGLPSDVRHLRRRAYADARAHASTRARRDARTFVTPDAAGPVPNAAPHANADLPAVRIVRRRPDVVLRHEGLEHLRLRRPQTQTVQSQEHGRRENSTRGLPVDVRHVLIPLSLIASNSRDITEN